MEENRDIRGLLQEQFANFEADPGVDLWAGIEAELHSPPAKNRKGVVWMSIAASFALLLSMLWLLQPSQKDGHDRIAEEHPISTPVIVPPVASTKQLTKESEETVLPREQEVPVQIAVNAPVEKKMSPKQSAPNQPVNLPPSEEESGQETYAETHPTFQVAPLNPMAASSWKSSKISSEIPQKASELIAAEVPKKLNAVQRELIHPKNDINFNNLTLGQAIVFASTEISKLANSPVEVRHEKGENEKVSTYKLNFFNVKVASNETTKTASDPDKTLASAEPIEKINTFQLDLFNFRIKKKTHKRVINKRKS
ncbi:MAG: hypothetical protein AAF587_04145 [Bacteroidota bacterium]